MNIINSINSIKYVNRMHINKKICSTHNFTKTLLEGVEKQENQQPINLDLIKENKKEVKNDLLNLTEEQEKEGRYFQVPELIGHHVLISGSKIFHLKNEDIIYGYELPENVSSLLIEIKDQRKKIVFSNKSGPQKAGPHTYYWNSQIDGEDIIPTGFYELSIQVENKFGKKNIPTLVHGIVQHVDRIENSNEYSIDLGVMGLVNIQDIKRIF